VVGGADPNLLVMPCESDGAADHAMSAHLYETVSALEPYRHKIESQYREYHYHNRERPMDGLAALVHQLQLVSKQASESAPAVVRVGPDASDQPRRHGRVLLRVTGRSAGAGDSGDVAGKRREPARGPGPADRPGGHHDPGVRPLRRRVQPASLRVAQVEADLGRAGPVFAVTRSVGQFSHGQLRRDENRFVLPKPSIGQPSVRTPSIPRYRFGEGRVRTTTKTVPSEGLRLRNADTWPSSGTPGSGPEALR